jgi:hypothetical protein
VKTPTTQGGRTESHRTTAGRPFSRAGRLIAGLSLALVLLAALAGSAQAASPAWKLLAGTGPTNLPPFTSEIQRILVNAEGGTFTLAFEGQETAVLPFDASPAELRTVLEALSTIGAGDVETSGGPGNASAGNPYFVRFAGSLADTDVGTMSADSTGLTGAAHTASIDTKTQGGLPGEGKLVVYPTNIGGATSSGPITITVGPLPSGITGTALGTEGSQLSIGNGVGWICSPAGSDQATVTCESSEEVPSGRPAVPLIVPLSVAATASPDSAVQVAVSGGGALLGTQTDVPLPVSSLPSRAGIQAFWAGAFEAEGASSTQAGAHPNLAATGFLVNTDVDPAGGITPAGDLRNVDVGLPPGFLGNPLLTPRCPQEALTPSRGGTCSNQSVVGTSAPFVTQFETTGFRAPSEPAAYSLYNDSPPFGYPAEFGFQVVSAVIPLLASVRSDSDYGLTVEAHSIAQTERVFGSVLTLFGAPAAAVGKAFLTNPTDCAEEAREAPTTTVTNNSWQDQDVTAIDNELTVTLPPMTNCAALGGHFRPGFSFQPTSHEAAAPSAFTAQLTIPQEGLTEPEALAAPQLKKAVVSLPRGVDVNPSSANGLEACSESQMGLTATSGALPNPIRFDRSEPTCPEASKLGTVEAKSPLLEETLDGTIYLAAQEENPFHSLLAIYAVIDSPKNGILVKLPGEVRPDPNTGQLTATFDDNPQLPVEDLKLNFRGGGPRSPLTTPAVCSTYTTSGELTPWSAPESGPPAQTEDSFQVSSGPGGGPCATNEGALPFSPSFEAGTTSTHAGAYAPLVIKVARKDGEQELTHLDFTLPPGLTGKLAGIPYCPDSAIAAAGGKTGKAEQAIPSCPAASELGTVDTFAGVGGEPIHVGGQIYLAGPYEGAPVSTVVITPAVAGPFDLGDVVIRAPLFVDPETAQITARSDEIPHILRGIPLQLRSVEIKVSRQGFTLNPTSCNPMIVSSSLSGLNGATAGPSTRFQVGACKQLKFKPKLQLSLKGSTKHTGHPALKAVVTYPQQGAYVNIARAQVNLPHSEFLDQSNLNKTCTKPVLLAGNCPKSTIYGRAKAWTPLLEKPLEGNVYLVGGYGYKLPALVADLDGQIRVVLKGKVDSGPNRGIRNTFEAVPDAPVSRFVLEMKGGKKYSLLENSENLCRKPQRAIARFTAQNGAVLQSKPLIANQCGKKKDKAKQRKEAKSHGAGA